MIKLDAPRSNNSSLTQVAHESGTNNSTVMNRLSAFAQRAMGFGNNVSRNFLKTSKTVALAVAAVFAFNAAQAQVYYNGFDGSVSINPKLTASSVPSAIATTLYACPGGGGALVTNAGVTNFDHDFVFTVAPGYILKIDSVTVDMKRGSGLGSSTTTLTNYAVSIDAQPYGASIASQTFGNSCTRVNTGGSYVSLAGATVTVELNGDVAGGAGNQDLLIDNFYIHGSVVCEAAAGGYFTVVSPTCGTGSVTIPAGSSHNGFNYTLWKNGVATASVLAGNGAALNFTGLTAGTYGVVATNSSDLTCTAPLTATGSTVILAQPNVYTVSGGGNVCANPLGTTTINLSGSQVGINYTLHLNGGAAVQTLPGSGNPLSFTVNAGGAYTVNSAANATYCVGTMTGSATVTVSQPTAFFASTTTGGGTTHLCAVNTGNPATNNNVTFLVKGTPGAVVQFSVADQNGVPSLNYNDQVTLLADSTATITVNSITNTTVVTLLSATTNAGCTQNLVSNNSTNDTALVRPELTNLTVSATQSLCSGLSYSSVTFGSTSGTAYPRTITYRYRTNSGVWTTTTVSLGTSSSATVTLASLGLNNTATVGTSYEFQALSVAYTNAPTCTYTPSSGPSITKSAIARPSFQFAMNGVNLRSGGRDTICVPSDQAVFTVIGTSGHTYSVTRNGAPFGSAGTINNNGSGTVTSINAPGGTYQVTVTGGGCDSVATFIVDEQQRPAFTYSVNGQTVSNGSVVNVCTGQPLVDTLKTSVPSGASTVTYVITGAPLAATGNTSSTSVVNLFPVNATSAPSVTVVTDYTVKAYVYNSPAPNFGACVADTVTFTLRVNPKPVFTVSFSTDQVAPFASVSTGSTVAMCEDRTPRMRVNGTPGHTVEIHYTRENNTGSFPSAYTQLQTGVINTSGYYEWNNPLGNYGSNYESGYDCANPNQQALRFHYKVEVKNPDTWCSDTMTFKARINQRPSVLLSYGTSNTATLTAMPGTGTTIAAPTDTLNICYTLGGSDIKYFVNWNTAGNQANLNCNTTNTLYFYLYKGTSTGALVYQGSLTSASSAQTHQMPITAGSNGLYTLVVSGTNTCDSVRSFWIKANESPIYSINETGTASVPGAVVAAPITGTTASSTNPIKYCLGYPKTATISGVNTSGSTQTYTLIRTGTTNVSTTSPAGSFTTVSGTLSASNTVINFNTLGVGVHHFLLTVTANPGACPVYRTFQVQVTEVAKPTLKWRPSVFGSTASGAVIAPNDTLTFCQEEEIEYTITGVPTGSPYWLFRNNVQIASGIATAVEGSVITLVQQPLTAGYYEIRARNTANGINCDSSYFFTVKVNDRPDIDSVVVTNVTQCHENQNGKVKYYYTTTVPGNVNTKLIRKYVYNYAGTNVNDSTLVLNSNSLQTSLSVEHPNLSQGHYWLIITNAVGCADTIQFDINGPAHKLYLDAYDVTPACPATTGNVTFRVYGGVAGYDMRIYDLNGIPVSSIFHLNDSTNFYQYVGLYPGSYTIRATDAAGCVKIDSFAIAGCTSPDLVPDVLLSSPNFSIANTTSIPYALDLYNLGQLATSGTIQVRVLLPFGFGLNATTAGWNSVYSAPFYTLSSASASVPVGGSITVNANIVKTGVPSVGFYAIVTNIVAGTGGEPLSNSGNNAQVSLFNVNP